MSTHQRVSFEGLPTEIRQDIIYLAVCVPPVQHSLSEFADGKCTRLATALSRTSRGIAGDVQMVLQSHIKSVSAALTERDGIEEHKRAASTIGPDGEQINYIDRHYSRYFFEWEVVTGDMRAYDEYTMLLYQWDVWMTYLDRSDYNRALNNDAKCKRDITIAKWHPLLVELFVDPEKEELSDI